MNARILVVFPRLFIDIPCKVAFLSKQENLSAEGGK